MKITQVKEVKTRHEVITGWQCDSCGITHTGSTIPDHWHEFVACADDWTERYLACSPECYSIQLKKAVDDSLYTDAVIDGFNLGFAKRMVDQLEKK
jgi:hypothetical protein